MIDFMTFDSLQHLAEDLRGIVGVLEPGCIGGADASRLLGCFVEIERLAAAGKLLMARRVESSNAWRRSGHRSAAAHLAEATGTGLGTAIDALKTARRLEALPATEEAVRAGKLSEVQAREITGAAILRPASERELVEAAGEGSLNVLRLRCRRVRATAEDQNATYEAIRRSRYLRHWTDTEGAVRLDARLTPDEGARIVAAVRRVSARFAEQARKSGRMEPATAHAADALVAIASQSDADLVPSGPRPGLTAIGGPNRRSNRGTIPRGSDASSDDPGTGPAADRPRSVTGPQAVIHVRVDHEALVRGHLEAGEVCEIPGVGPIPIATARRLAEDAILHVLVTDGVNVRAVVNAGRTIPASVRAALVERDQTCVIPGCDARDRLEIDHVVPFASGGPTSLDNLAMLCHWHHYLKTHQGYRLSRDDGAWWWSPPDPAGLARPPDSTSDRTTDRDDSSG